MAVDLATLSLRIENAQALSAAQLMGARLEEMGVKGEAAASKIAASSNPVTAAIKQQAIDYTQLTARAGDFARAGASAAQVSQMAGVSMAQAAAAVKMYSGTVAKAEIDVVGLKAAQAQLALANMAVGESAVVAGAAFSLSGAHAGRLREGLSSMVSMMTGVPALATRIASTVGVMTIGMSLVLPILLAIGAAAWVWDKLTEGTRKAREENDKLNKSLLDQADAIHRVSIAGAQEEVNRTKAQATAVKGESGAGFFSLMLQGMAPGGQSMNALTTGDAAAHTKAIGDAAIEAQQAVNNLGMAIAHLNDSGTGAAKKDATQAIRDAKEYADAIARAVAETNKLNLEQAKKTVGIDTDRTNADLLLAAAQQGTLAYQDQVDAIAVQNKLLADGIYWFDARYDAAKKSLEITVAERRETEAIVKATQDAATAAKEAATRAAEEAARPFKNMMRELQTEFAKFFDNIFTKGIKSFGDLVSSIKDMFLKMFAEILAAGLMKKLAGVLGAMMGAASVAGAQGTGGAGGGSAEGAGLGGFNLAGTAGMGIGMAAAGFGVGSSIGNMTTNRALGALGGAAGGAATGAAIGAMGGPIGVVAGAFIGAAAGAIGGFLGAGNAARQAAEALRAMQLAEAQVGATLADWRAQITGTAADQKAAALMDLKLKYMEIVAEIQKQEAGKKMEAQRNADLTEAARLYALNNTAITNNTAALQALTELNVVSGYRLQATIFAAMNPHGSGPPSNRMPSGGRGGVSGGTDNSNGGLTPPGDQSVTLVLADGTQLGKAVLKGFRNTAQKQFGDSNKWSLIQ